MINVSLVLIYILTVTTIISTPGPVVMLVVNSTLKHNFFKGIATIAGTNLSSLILMTVAILIIYGFVSINYVFLNYLRIVGCLYLIYIALESLVHILKTKKNSTTDLQLKDENKKNGGFLKGFYVGLSNPKDIIFFASLFPQFILVSPNRWLGLSILSLLWLVLDWLILLAYVILLSKFVAGKFKEKLIFVSSLVLLGIGIMGLLIRN